MTTATQSPVKLTRMPAQKLEAPAAPGVERLRQAFLDASNAIEHAKDKALYCGFLMIEQSAALSGDRNKFDTHKPDDAKISVWLQRNIPEIPLRTAQRWMQAAERSGACVRMLANSMGKGKGGAAVIDIEAFNIPMSQLISMPASELPAGAAEYRQIWMDFVSDKTIKDCTNAVIEGDKEPHAITRAHNGKNAKGAGGSGDRKDFPKFTAQKLGHITTFLKNKLPPDHQAQIGAAFLAFLQTAPKWLLEVMEPKLKAEIKMADTMRAARNEEKQ